MRRSEQRTRQSSRSHGSRGAGSGGSGRTAYPTGTNLLFKDKVLYIDRPEVPVSPTSVFPREVPVVYTESSVMNSLLQEISDLKAAVRGIESHLGIARQAITLRQIPDDMARVEILAAFDQAGDDPLYYDDLSEKLCIPIEQASRICEALINEGVIGEKTPDE
jgi:hypothetical protein